MSTSLGWKGRVTFGEGVVDLVWLVVHVTMRTEAFQINGVRCEGGVGGGYEGENRTGEDVGPQWARSEMG